MSSEELDDLLLKFGGTGEKERGSRDSHDSTKGYHDLVSELDKASSSGAPDMPPPPPPHREAEVQVVVKVDLGPQRATMSAVEDLDKIIGEMEKIEKKEEKKEEWAPSQSVVAPPPVKPHPAPKKESEAEKIARNVSERLASPSDSNRKKCHKCNNQIVSGEIITAKGKHYHPDHFTCRDCNRAIGTTPFYEDSDHHYCENCYVNKHLSKCGQCGRPIDGTAIAALGKKYHPEHFVCSRCLAPFPTGQFYEKDGRAYCEHDYHDTFGVKCDKCGGHVEGACTKALGRHFHAKCFVCATCHRELGSSYFERDGRAYCEQHSLEASGTCAGCGKAIYGKSLSALNRKWHPEHFSCTNCRQSISGPFNEVDGKPYCKPCSAKLFKA